MSRIKTIKGNMLTGVKEGYMLNGCNCQGVMGSGLAKEVKERFPEAYEDYREWYCSGRLELGEVQYIPLYEWTDADDKYEGDFFLVNCMTQEYYGTGKRHLDYEALATCIEKINHSALEDNAPRVLNFPMIGCGLAGGNWEIVKTIIEECAPDMELVYWEFR